MSNVDSTLLNAIVYKIELNQYVIYNIENDLNKIKSLNENC